MSQAIFWCRKDGSFAAKRRKSRKMVSIIRNYLLAPAHLWRQTTSLGVSRRLARMIFTATKNER